METHASRCPLFVTIPIAANTEELQKVMSAGDAEAWNSSRVAADGISDLKLSKSLLIGH
jgi:hypothetical protein